MSSSDEDEDMQLATPLRAEHASPGDGGNRACEDEKNGFEKVATFLASMCVTVPEVKDMTLRDLGTALGVQGLEDPPVTSATDRRCRARSRSATCQSRTYVWDEGGFFENLYTSGQIDMSVDDWIYITRCISKNIIRGCSRTAVPASPAGGSPSTPVATPDEQGWLCMDCNYRNADTANVCTKVYANGKTCDSRLACTVPSKLEGRGDRGRGHRSLQA